MSFGFRQELQRRVLHHQFQPYEPFRSLRDATRDLKECLCCGKLARKMPVCSGCKWARYCGERCQRADWGRHKVICCPDHCLRGGVATQGLGGLGSSAIPLVRCPAPKAHPSS